MKYITLLYRQKSLQVLMDQAMFSGGSFLTTLLLARLLAPEVFGHYAAVVIVLYLMTSIGNALTIQPYQVLYAREENPKNYTAFIHTLQILFLSTTVLLLGTAYTFFMDLPSWQHATGAITLFAAMYLLHDFLRKALLTQDRPGVALTMDCILTASQTCILLWWSIDQYKPSLTTVGLTLSLTYIIPVLLAYVLVPAFISYPRGWRIYIRPHFQQVPWLVGTAVIQWWASNMFVVASGIFLGTVALGAFRLVQSLFGVLNLLLQTFENYALPLASRHYIQSVDAAKCYLRKISLQGGLVFGVVLLILFIYAPQIMTLAGGEAYRDYYAVIRGMCVLYIFIFIGYPIRLAIRMMLMNRVFFTGYVLSLIFSSLTFHQLLGGWGLWGALVGLIVNQLIMIIFWQYSLYKKAFYLWR